MEKYALVTGGNRGIGLEVCFQLAEKGFTVFLGTRKMDALGARIKENSNLIPVILDVTDTESIHKAVEVIEKKAGCLDVLINNAGISIGSKRLISVAESDFRNVLETNFFGPFNMVQYFLPLLRKSEHARIINVSSRMGQWSSLTGGYGAYRMSKVGLNAMSKMFDSELASEKIKVYGVCPGWVRTDMGGKGATLSVTEGADTITWLATKKNIPSGKFYAERKEIIW